MSIRYDSINLQLTLIFVCIKINFIPHFLFEILQRFCKLIILDTLGMNCHVYHIGLNFRKVSCLSPCKKSTSSHHSNLRQCEGIAKLFLSILDISGYGHQKRWYQFVENGFLSSCQKSNLSLTFFEILSGFLILSDFNTEWTCL